MYRKTVMFVAALLLSMSAYALPSVPDAEAAVGRGDYPAAEQMTREVIAARPDSAKAHYIYAELLAHDGNLTQARAEAERAQSIDPAIRFTSPDRFRAFEAQLESRQRSRNAPATYAPSNYAQTAPRQSSGIGWVIGFFAVILLLIGVASLFRRARGAMPMSYGGSPMPPMGGYPPSYQPPMGSGMGSSIAAGLGGLATGMLIERALDGSRDERIVETPQPVNDTTPDLRDEPIDFGTGNDWGGDSGGGGGFDSGGDSW